MIEFRKLSTGESLQKKFCLVGVAHKTEDFLLSPGVFALTFLFLTLRTMESKSILVDQPVEILVNIFSQLDSIREINAVRQTCKYFNHVVSYHSNETTIVRAMSKSSKFSIAANQPRPDGYDSILRIYPAELYSPTGLMSYAWLCMIEQRMAKACSLSALAPPTQGYFSDDPGTGRWHSDAIHFLWRFLETPSPKGLECFLNTLDSRMVIRMADVLETAISCGLRALAYRSLPVPGARVPAALSFRKIVCDVRRRGQLGSTRNFGSRERLIQFKNLSRGHLLGLAEMFICGNSDIVGQFSRAQPSHLRLSDQIDKATRRDKILTAVKVGRLWELGQLNPTLLESINQEMHHGGMQ